MTTWVWLPPMSEYEASFIMMACINWCCRCREDRRELEARPVLVRLSSTSTAASATRECCGPDCCLDTAASSLVTSVQFWLWVRAVNKPLRSFTVKLGHLMDVLMDS